MLYKVLFIGKAYIPMPTHSPSDTPIPTSTMLMSQILYMLCNKNNEAGNGKTREETLDREETRDREETQEDKELSGSEGGCRAWVIRRQQRGTSQHRQGRTVKAQNHNTRLEMK